MLTQVSPTGALAQESVLVRGQKKVEPLVARDSEAPNASSRKCHSVLGETRTPQGGTRG